MLAGCCIADAIGGRVTVQCGLRVGIVRAPAMSMDRDRICVLVVDDDPDVRELVGHALESLGIEVTAVPSVQDALSAIEEHTPDVVISDIGMPDQDGYWLIRCMRANPVDAKNSIPAIALTAFASAKDRSKALMSGFDLHMTKPVELSALAKAVTDLAHGASLHSSREG